MRLVLACLIALLTAHRVASAGIDLSWNTCVTQTPADDLSPACEEGGSFTLYANFQSPQAIPGFVAIDAVFDLDAGDELLPFWHLQTGGCNDGGLVVLDARPEGACPAASNPSPWGTGGAASDAFLSAYAPGMGGGGRAAFVVSVVRASSSPVALVADQNYYAFHMDFFTDAAASCQGCGSPANISWRTAALYDVSSGAPPTVMAEPGQRSKLVTLNGGVPGLRLYSSYPLSANAVGPVGLRVFGKGIEGGTTLRLEHPDATTIVGTQIEAGVDGRSLEASVDLTDVATGPWDIVLEAPGGWTARATGAFEVQRGFSIMSFQPETLTITSDSLVVVGHGFRSGATLSLRAPGGEFPASSIRVSADGDTLWGTIYLLHPQTSRYHVVVTNPDGQQAVSGTMIRLAFPPDIDAITPTLAREGFLCAITASGALFSADCRASLERAGEAEIPLSAVVVSDDGRTLTGVADLHGRRWGPWDLVATNPTGGSTRVGSALVIVAQPTIDSITPSARPPGGTMSGVIHGRDFAWVPTVVRMRGPATYLESSIATVSTDGASVAFEMAVPRGTRLGPLDVTVASASIVEVTIEDGFQVVAGRKAKVDSITHIKHAVPEYLAGGRIHGRDFGEEAEVLLVRGTDVLHFEGVPLGPPLVPGTALQFQDFLPAETAIGRYHVLVNSEGQLSDTLLDAFDVFEGVKLDSIVPSRGTDLSTLTVTAYGQRFRAGMQVSLNLPGIRSISTSNRVISSDSVRFDVDLRGRPTGLYDLHVSHPLADNTSLPGAFALLYGPRIDSLAPRQVFSSGLAHVRLYGRPFPPLNVVELRRTGEEPIIGTVMSEFSRPYLDVVFDVRGRSSGSWDVVVTTSAFISDTLEGAFGTLPGEEVEEALSSGIEIIEDSPTSTLVEVFEAERSTMGVKLRLRLSSRRSDRWIAIDRREGPHGPWGTVLPDTILPGVECTFSDDAAPEGAVWYRVRQREDRGLFEVIAQAVVGVVVQVATTELAAIQPNPSVGAVRIQYSLAGSGAARLHIHDVQGRRVASLVEGIVGQGRHLTTWTPRGDRHATGIYFVVMEADGQRFVRRFLLTR